MSYGEKLVAAVLVLVNAVIVVLTTTQAVHWSGEQITLVTVESNSVAALILALYFHFKSGTKKEPVAVGAALTAVVVATLYLLNGFDKTHLTEAAITAVGGAVTAGVLVVTTAFARDSVVAPTTPPVTE